jgi:hypothetical protein
MDYKTKQEKFWTRDYVPPVRTGVKRVQVVSTKKK